MDLTVEGDADMLYQVVLNLVVQRRQVHPRGRPGDRRRGHGQPHAKRRGHGLRHGARHPSGLPCRRLFEKFYRIENYKRVAKGTGLGLSLCKHIVETVHHGQIGVESKLGMGSRFWFSVPMQHAGSQAAA